MILLSIFNSYSFKRFSLFTNYQTSKIFFIINDFDRFKHIYITISADDKYIYGMIFFTKNSYNTSQKCHYNNWRSPEERKFIFHPSGQGSSSGFCEPRSSFRKFGTMPRHKINVPNMQCNLDKIQRSPESSLPNLNINDIFA